MNKIYIETSVGELIDKITILEIKKKKISDENSVDIVSNNIIIVIIKMRIILNNSIKYRDY